MAKTPEELAAAKTEREKIAATTVNKEATKEEPEKETSEEDEDGKSTDDETGLDGTSEDNQQQIEDTKKEIKESEKTQETLEAEKLEAKTAAEKERIQKRINKEVAKTKKLEDENAELKRQLAAKESGDDPKFTKEDIDKEADILANQKIAQRDFDNTCAKLQKEATKLDKDFPDKIKELGEDVGLIPGAMIGVLGDLDNGAQVLKSFTDDPEEYERLINLPPLKMATALTKYAEKLAKPKPKPLSKVPEPHEPLGGNARMDTPLNDKDSMDVWIKKRNAQAEAFRKAKLAN